jgi:hypothetical protein
LVQYDAEFHFLQNGTYDDDDNDDDDDDDDDLRHPVRCIDAPPVAIFRFPCFGTEPTTFGAAWGSLGPKAVALRNLKLIGKRKHVLLNYQYY